MEAIQKSIIQVSKRDVKVKGDNLIINYKGKEYSFAFKQISKRLAKASQKARENFILSPSGYGIHWPDADEDLSVGGLLKAVLK
jgi:hypothetical protein